MCTHYLILLIWNRVSFKNRSRKLWYESSPTVPKHRQAHLISIINPHKWQVFQIKSQCNTVLLKSFTCCNTQTRSRASTTSWLLTVLGSPALHSLPMSGWEQYLDFNSPVWEKYCEILGKAVDRAMDRMSGQDTLISNLENETNHNHHNHFKWKSKGRNPAAHHPRAVNFFCSFLLENMYALLLVSSLADTEESHWLAKRNMNYLLKKYYNIQEIKLFSLLGSLGSFDAIWDKCTWTVWENHDLKLILCL